MRSKVWFYGLSLAWVAGSDAGEGMAVRFECCVSSGRGLYDGPIPRQRSSTECVCVSLSVIWCIINLLHLPRVERRGQNKKKRKEEVMTYIEMEVVTSMSLNFNL